MCGDQEQQWDSNEYKWFNRQFHFYHRMKIDQTIVVKNAIECVSECLSKWLLI